MKLLYTYTSPDYGFTLVFFYIMYDFLHKKCMNITLFSSLKVIFKLNQILYQSYHDANGITNLFLLGVLVLSGG